MPRCCKPSLMWSLARVTKKTSHDCIAVPRRTFCPSSKRPPVNRGLRPRYWPTVDQRISIINGKGNTRRVVKDHGITADEHIISRFNTFQHAKTQNPLRVTGTIYRNTSRFGTLAKTDHWECSLRCRRFWETGKTLKGVLR